MHWLQCCGNAEGWGGLTLGFAEDGVMGGGVKFSLGEKGGGMIVEGTQTTFRKTIMGYLSSARMELRTFHKFIS